MALLDNIVVSDALFFNKRLKPEHKKAVILHELGHIYYDHVSKNIETFLFMYQASVLFYYSVERFLFNQNISPFGSRFIAAVSSKHLLNIALSKSSQMTNMKQISLLHNF